MESFIPKNLIVIVVSQTLLLGALVVSRYRFRFINKIRWKVALAIGVGYGISMDALLGMVGVFAYYPSGQDAGYVSPYELSLGLLLFNAFASYGVAALTVSMVAPEVVVSRSIGERTKITTGFALIGSLFLAILSPSDSVVLMFSWGCVIISVSELILSYGGRSGPLLELLIFRNYKPLMFLVVFSLAVGSVYEVVNAAFPFWIWLPGSVINPYFLTVLVATLGYVVLFYPIIALYVLISEDKNDASR